jgi:hypothetical protein
MSDYYYTDLCFKSAVCKCSFRTAIEEEKYGSYCEKCWIPIKEHMKCVLCDLSVYKERLYVDAKFNVPTCKKCFLNKNFDALVQLKGFPLLFDLGCSLRNKKIE